jgi:hypothetical protein
MSVKNENKARRLQYDDTLLKVDHQARGLMDDEELLKQLNPKTTASLRSIKSVYGEDPPSLKMKMRELQSVDNNNY